jgi:polyribonucleotide nucleotidyltransferase
MLEAGAHGASDEEVAAAIRLAQQHVARAVAPQVALAQQCGKPKRWLPLLGPPRALQQAVDGLGEELFMQVRGGCCVSGSRMD